MPHFTHRLRTGLAMAATSIALLAAPQLALADEGDSENLSKKLRTSKSVEEVFRNAQKAFNVWSKSC